MKSTNWFLKTLVALRIFDTDYTLSWTSLYLAMGFAICISQPITANVVALLTLILAHANLKRIARHKAQGQQDAHNLKMQDLDATLEASKSVANERIEKIESELLKLIQANNISKLGR